MPVLNTHRNFSAWSDSLRGIERLKSKYFVCVYLQLPSDAMTFIVISVVLANGTTRLQLDIVKSAGLPFDTLLSSQLLELTKVNKPVALYSFQLMTGTSILAGS